MDITLLKDIGSFAYFGDLNTSKWASTHLGYNRDSDCVQLANWQAIQNALTKLPKWVQKHFTVERYSHWACGYVKTLLVNTKSRKALDFVEDIQKQLSDYPILDENLYSELESEKTWTYLKRELVAILRYPVEDYNQAITALYDHEGNLPCGWSIEGNLPDSDELVTILHKANIPADGLKDKLSYADGYSMGFQGVATEIQALTRLASDPLKAVTITASTLDPDDLLEDFTQGFNTGLYQYQLLRGLDVSN